jgi:methylated-DNA-[protein]-cysteine S-methyltransferase
MFIGLPALEPLFLRQRVQSRARDLTFLVAEASANCRQIVRRGIMAAMSEAPVSAAGAAHTTISTSLGDLTVVARDGVVTGIYFPHHWHLPDPAGFGQYRAAGPGDVFDDVRGQLGEYLAGERRDFNLPVEATGSAFQQRVWDRLTQIPYGATVTYGELARELGGGVTAQEVGTAVGRNPVSIIIPCHRVVGAGGGLTGYAGGLHRKRALLDLEQDTAGQSARLF